MATLGRLARSCRWTPSVLAKTPVKSLSQPRFMSMTAMASRTVGSTTNNDIQPREKPGSLSYFTGNFKYNDLLIELDGLYQRHNDWKGKRSIDTPLNVDAEDNDVMNKVYSWKICSKMSEMLGMSLTTSQWRKIISHLNALAFLPRPLPADVASILARYERADSAQQKDSMSKPKSLDDMGRAYAVGRRKEASARCWVVEGEGKVLVNGEELDAYFPRPCDVDQVLLPFKVTETEGKYNVWILTNGGGSTGKAEAMKLGISRALLIHNVELKPLLRQAGCITRDPRVVERKKEGQRKARAKYTWVKR